MSKCILKHFTGFILAATFLFDSLDSEFLVCYLVLTHGEFHLDYVVGNALVHGWLCNNSFTYLIMLHLIGVCNCRGNRR